MPRKERQPPNPRLEPLVVESEIEESDLVPLEMRANINRIAKFEFSETDFHTFSEGLAICRARWRERKQAPKQGEVITCLQEIGAVALKLRDLLHPYMADPQITHPATVDAANRVQYALADPELPDWARRAPQLLYYIDAVTRRASGKVKNLPTLTQGPDAAHLTSLVAEIRMVLQRNNLRKFYFVNGEERERHGLAADIAVELSKLLPKEIAHSPPWPTKSAFKARLAECADASWSESASKLKRKLV